MAGLGLARPSVAHRRTAFAATLVSVVLATALIGAFATLLEASGNASAADRETLVVMGAVVGSWGCLIALFSLASTVGLSIRRREHEVALLRVVGATPAQVRRLVRREVLVVSVAGTVLGSGLAWVGGRGLLALLRDGGLVEAGVRSGTGSVAVATTAVALIVVAQAAAWLAGRRATRVPVRLVLVDAATGRRPLPRGRLVAGVLLVAYGLTAGILTMTVMPDVADPYAPMQTAGTAGIVVSVGLALLGPVLLRWVSRPLRPLARTATGHLASEGAAIRPTTLAGVLGAVIVFVGAGVGVSLMVGIDGRTLDALVPDAQEADTITLLNYVVTGMITLFAAIMVVNSLVAATSARRDEFERLSLAGADRRQITRLVLTEGLVVAGLGAALGTLAGAVTAVPYAIARGEGLVPNGQLWIVPVTAGLALVLLLSTGGVAARRTVARPGPRATAAL